MKDKAREVAERILDNNTKKLIGVSNIDCDNIFVECHGGFWRIFKPGNIKPGYSISINCSIKDYETGTLQHEEVHIKYLESFNYDKENGKILAFSSSTEHFISDDVFRAIGEIALERNAIEPEKSFDEPEIGNR